MVLCSTILIIFFFSQFVYYLVSSVYVQILLKTLKLNFLILNKTLLSIFLLNIMVLIKINSFCLHISTHSSSLMIFINILCFLFVFLGLFFFIDVYFQIDAYGFFFIIFLLFNLLFCSDNLFYLLILFELLSLSYFFFFSKFLLAKLIYSNDVFLFYLLIINFCSSILFIFYFSFSLWNTGVLSLSGQFLIVKSQLFSLFLLGLLIKLGLIPFFSFKFALYKILPLNVLFFYSFSYFSYFCFLIWLLPLGWTYSWIHILYCLLVLNIIYSFLHKYSIREMLFFSSLSLFLIIFFYIL